MSTIKQKLAVFAIGLALTLAIGTTVGGMLVVDQSHLAHASGNHHHSGSNTNNGGNAAAF
jgi:hypothetical protein